MIVDPMQVLATPIAILATSLPSKEPINPGVPTSVAPIPTVIPDKPEYQLSTETGVRTLWVVFIVMLIASLIFAYLAWTVPVRKRFFHVITTVITIVAALSYFAMATGHGTSLHRIILHEEHDTVPDTKHVIYRQVFYARYIDWLITTPLLLLDLTVLAGLSGAHIFIVIVADLIMVVTGLFASYARVSSQKWGWFAIGIIGYLVVIWHLVVNGRTAAVRRSSTVANFYTSIAGFFLVVWTVYPIIWGVSEGARKLSVDKEIIAFAVLDILAKVGFGAWLLATHSRVPETQVDLGGFWTHGFTSEGQLRLDGDEGA